MIAGSGDSVALWDGVILSASSLNRSELDDDSESPVLTSSAERESEVSESTWLGGMRVLFNRGSKFEIGAGSSSSGDFTFFFFFFPSRGEELDFNTDMLEGRRMKLFRARKDVVRFLAIPGSSGAGPRGEAENASSASSGTSSMVSILGPAGAPPASAVDPCPSLSLPWLSAPLPEDAVREDRRPPMELTRGFTAL